MKQILFFDEHYEEVKNAKWNGLESEIEVQGFKIKNPFLFTTNSNEKSVACHIVPIKLPASNKEEEDYDDMGYWPSFSDLTSSQRGKFLKWLSDGKEDPTIDIGYVFIYFYGLEYRVVKEGQDLEEIGREVIRLRKYYASNNSFRNYSENLLAYIISNLENTETAMELFREIKDNLKNNSIIYRSGINFKLKKSSKLSVDDLIKLIPTFEKVIKSIIPIKVEKYFNQYFKIIAKQEIDEAIKLIDLEEYDEFYHSASSFIGRDHTFKGVHAVVDRIIQDKLTKKWEQTIDTLRPYSRKISKKTSEEIFNLLPEELRKTLDHPLKDKIEKLSVNSLNKPVKLIEIIDILGMSISEKIKQKESKKIVDALLSQNIIIEPDLSYFQKNYKQDEVVYLSKVNNATALDSQDYKLAALMADFGADLAYSDNDYSQKEAKQIYDFVSSQFLKKEIEKEHLKLRVELYKYQKPRMNKLFEKLTQKLNLNDLKILGSYLVQVALADGRFTIEEDRKIKKVFSKLGLDESYVKDLYAEFGINEVLGNTELRSSNTIGTKENLTNIKREFVINREKVNQLTSETKEISHVLSRIITIEEEASSPPLSTIPLKTKKEKSDLFLNKRTHVKCLIEVLKNIKFLIEILKKDEWNKKEFREKAKEFNLMVNVVISNINEWSEEEYGDHLIFESDNYQIQKNIMESKDKNLLSKKII